MNELGGTLGGIFDTFLPEIARKKLEDSGLIQKQEPPATERTPRAVNRSTLPPWLIPVAAVAGVVVVLWLVMRKS